MEVGGLGSARSWEDARVLMGGPRENPRSLSSPKLELRPKNSKKGGNGGLRGVGGRGEKMGGMQGFWGRFTRKLQVSIRSQT